MIIPIYDEGVLPSGFLTRERGYQIDPANFITKPFLACCSLSHFKPSHGGANSTAPDEQAGRLKRKTVSKGFRGWVFEVPGFRISLRVYGYGISGVERSGF